MHKTVVLLGLILSGCLMPVAERAAEAPEGPGVPRFDYGCPGNPAAAPPCQTTATPGGGPTVVALAVHPRQPSTVVVGVQTTNPADNPTALAMAQRAPQTSGSYLEVSQDNGATWQRKDLPFLDTGELYATTGPTQVDLTDLSFDGQGVLWVAGKASRESYKEYQVEPAESSVGGFSRPFVLASTDAGQSWSRNEVLTSPSDGPMFVGTSPTGPVLAWENAQGAFLSQWGPEGWHDWKLDGCQHPGKPLPVENETLLACRMEGNRFGVFSMRGGESPVLRSTLPGGDLYEFQLVSGGGWVHFVTNRYIDLAAMEAWGWSSPDGGRTWGEAANLAANCIACANHPKTAIQSAAADSRGRLQVILALSAWELVTPPTNDPWLRIVHAIYEPQHLNAVASTVVLSLPYLESGTIQAMGSLDMARALQVHGDGGFAVLQHDYGGYSTLAFRQTEPTQ